jgi:hypothetical protein
MKGYTIYANPSDYPGQYVVRGWTIRVPYESVSAEFDETPLLVCATLSEARRVLPVGLMRALREPEDDPVIVESWV